MKYFWIILCAATLSFAAEDVDTLIVTFSNPSQPGTVKSDMIMGGIKVRTHTRNDVLILSKTSEKASRVVLPDLDFDMDVFVDVNNERDNEPDPEKIEGLQKIQSSQFGVNVEEENNIIEINVPPMALLGGMGQEVEIVVPKNTSLQLKSMGGEIHVENVTGEIEVEAMGGGIRLDGVGGTVVANTMGNIEATMTNVSPDKPMAFSTFGGDIDVTLPATIKATFILKSHGDIYTDFDASKRKLSKNVSQSRENDRYEGRIVKLTEIPVNGGGPDIEFTNFSGNIYIRKGK